jgi:hypothetical protein
MIHNPASWDERRESDAWAVGRYDVQVLTQGGFET